MCLGICMSAANGVYFKKPLDIIYQFVPQLTFMLSLFGYLSFMIIFKWCTDWSNSNPPYLLNVMIDMFLSPGFVSDEDRLYEGQVMKLTRQILISI